MTSMTLKRLSMPSLTIFFLLVIFCSISASAFRSGGITVPKTASLVIRKSTVRSDDIPLAFESSTPAPLDGSKKQVEKTKKKWRLQIKPPENAFVLGGDVLTLMTYALMDHGVTYHMASKILKDPTLLTPDVLEQFNMPLDPIHPVWLDATSTTAEQLTKIQATVAAGHLQYSPAFASTGLTAVMLTICWIGSGMLVGAFDDKRTFDCSLHEMLRSVGMAWVGTCGIMVGIALFTDFSVCGCPHHPNFGLTKCDADFLADSLTVLLSWRTVVSVVFGNNGRSERRHKK